MPSRNRGADTTEHFLQLVATFFRVLMLTLEMELIMTAGRDVIVDLLEILDDCKRAQNQIESLPDMKEAKEGVLLVFNKLRTKLQNRGLKPMQRLNQEFNPDFHEAITEIPAPSEELKGKVLEVLNEGYYLNDILIRHAKVVVGK